MQSMYGNQRVLVLGMGDSGLSACRWLCAHGAQVTVADSRSAPPQLARFQQDLPQVSIHLGPFDDMLFGGIDYAVVSPGIALAEPAIARAQARGVPMLGDVELFARWIRDWPSKVIAITGSNGKSTVTSLVGHLCQQAGLKTMVAGNIGLPVLDALEACEEDRADGAAYPDVFVLELSSFQLETTNSLRCDSATVLNLSEDHLDRYDGMDGYAAAKQRIFLNAKAQVLNRDDARSWAMRDARLPLRSFALATPQSASEYGLLDRADGLMLARGDQALLPVLSVPLPGLHNAANVLSALALLDAAGLPLATLLPHVASFRGLPHRVEPVLTLNGVTFIDDSKGTNVGATEAALLGFDRGVRLIAGGDGKGQDFSPLQHAVQRSTRAVYLIGRDAAQIEAALQGSGVPVQHCADLPAAVEAAWADAQDGEVILLSPACASLDMFRNYAHRAEVFIAAANAIAARVGGAHG
ncbi:UDP-N-acetylmuramoyl-L-alanine--D-glutamate ligase [Leeia sp. IMCC25680]|uniref:UDP-N-acetylmuramoylalanine--D-glutamate ligase n=2 Tax=Leeia aquatica TaxID=2725557 RepID=A0A847SCH7_9NEIS|nr:UDP-N-acetylmuramoyl-L-alanine--D-glutamate ligase [Leeia aquatica]